MLPPRRPDASSLAHRGALNDCDHGNDQHEYDGHGGGLTHVVVVEAGIDDLGHHRRGRGAVDAPGPAQEIHLVEEPEGEDRGDESDEDQGVSDARHRDIEELSPFVGTVERCRLVKFGRHALQRRKNDDHLEADALPDRHDDDRSECCRGIAEPVVAGI
jgi:hypothetical protein